MSAAASQQQVTSSTEVAVSTSAAGLGRITLCRERQLNALGAEHVEVVRAQLLQWGQAGCGIKCVLMDSNNERSFCSGANAHLIQGGERVGVGLEGKEQHSESLTKREEYCDGPGRI